MVMSAALAFVNKITSEPIANTEKQKEINALESVSPEFDNDAISTKQTIGDLEYFVLLKGTDTVGYAVKTYTEKGFSGYISLMVGFDAEGKVYNYAILKHKETPGLGTKLSETKFKSQFENLSLEGFEIKVKKDGGDVDAITAATISSRAFCDALDRAYAGLKENFLNK
jgi:electron transport complex protein RnfG